MSVSVSVSLSALPHLDATGRGIVLVQAAILDLWLTNVHAGQGRRRHLTETQSPTPAVALPIDQGVVAKTAISPGLSQALVFGVGWEKDGISLRNK